MTEPAAGPAPVHHHQEIPLTADHLPKPRVELPAPTEADHAAAERWLAEAPERSTDALAALQAVPPPTAGSSPFIWARNETEFRQGLDYAAEENIVALFDPRTEIELTETITIRQRVNVGYTWGANGNHARLAWNGPVGDDMLVIEGVQGVPNRALFLEKFNFFGNGWIGRPCGACLKLAAPLGDDGPLYKFTLRDIFTSYGTYGVVLSGGVYEGLFDNVHCENHRRDGTFMEHTHHPGVPPGIVSNVAMVHPNMSRNLGAGIRSVYSVYMTHGSFINNAEGGVVAPEGLRTALLCNGENTGEAVFVVPWRGWGSTIGFCEGSTDGVTHARQFQNGEWVSVGKPMFYLLDRGTDESIEAVHSHISGYGGVDHSRLHVIRPR